MAARGEAISSDFEQTAAAVSAAVARTCHSVQHVALHYKSGIVKSLNELAGVDAAIRCHKQNNCRVREELCVLRCEMIKNNF